MGADVCRQQLAPVDYLTSATTDDTGAVLRTAQKEERRLASVGVDEVADHARRASRVGASCSA